MDHSRDGRSPIGGDTQRVGLAAVLALLAATGVAGCGGGVGEDEIMRVARLRAQINAQNNKGDDPSAEPSVKPQKTAAEVALPDPSASPAKPSPGTAPPQVNVTAGGRDPSAVTSLKYIGPVDDASRKLAKIGEALQAAAVQSKRARYLRFRPKPDSDDDYGRLSWRVFLLPHLGYDDLFRKFKLDRDWNQSPNLALLSEMPDIYQSEGLASPSTRFLAVVGAGAVMHTGASYSAVTDRAADTVLVVENGSFRGVPWTKPEDFDHTAPGAFQSLGLLRGGYVYSAWADGAVHALDMSKPADALMSAFKYSAKDKASRPTVAATLDAKKMAAQGVEAVASSPAGSGSRTASAAPRDLSVAPVPGPSPSGAASVAPAPEGLAANCLSAAKLTRSQGAAPDAWNWLQGAIVADLPLALWGDSMRWTRALRRPTLGLHWAVGVSEGRSSDARSASGTKPSRAHRNEIIRVTAPLGEPLLQMVEKAAGSSQPELLELGEETAASPVTYLSTTTSIAELLTDANERGADVLLVFDVNKNPGGRVKSVELIFYDVARRAQLNRLGKMADRGDRNEGRRKDSLQKARWALGDYIEDELTPGEWPVRLTEKIAAKRLRDLGRMETGFPPRQLIEMRYYRALGLVDDAQLLQAVNELLGGDQGVNLLLGNDTKRRRVIRQWLPHDDPAEYLASRESRRRRDDDDD